MCGETEQANGLILKPVNELFSKNNTFCIPDYQRGYRWTELETKRLVTDLKTFFGNSDNNEGYYCLQPIIVAQRETNKWELIDGQQRLTTLLLILNAFKNDDLFKDIKNDDLLCKIKDINISLEFDSKDSKDIMDKLNQNTEDESSSIKASESMEEYYIQRVYKYVSDCIKNDTEGTNTSKDDKIDNEFMKNVFLEDKVKFIWYDVTNELKTKSITPEEKFSDLNINKIRLTNAELIKSLFILNLSEGEQEENDAPEQIKLAQEWDSVENGLAEEEFWAFFCGGEDKKYGHYDVKIDFLFDIVKKKETESKNVNPDPYFTYEEYAKEFEDSEDKKKLVGEKWNELMEYYYIFRGWYMDRELYHLIGFLRYGLKSAKNKNASGKISILDIKDIFDKSENNNMFKQNLRATVLWLLNSIIPKKYKEPISKQSQEEEKPWLKLIISKDDQGDLKQKKEKIDTIKRNIKNGIDNFKFTNSANEIYDLLVFVNIADVLECKGSDVRFSFYEFYKQKNKSKNVGWDIEHISSQSDKDPTGADLKEWIYMMIDYFTGIDALEKNGPSYKYFKNFKIKNRKDEKKDILDLKIDDKYWTAVNYVKQNEEITGYLDKLENLYKQKMDSQELNMDIYNELIEKYGTSFTDDETEHSIGNLALLDSGTNRGYKNAFFAVKCRWIYERERKGIYMLPATKNVFHKSYSSAKYDLLHWKTKDANEYMEKMKQLVDNFYEPK